MGWIGLLEVVCLAGYVLTFLCIGDLIAWFGRDGGGYVYLRVEKSMEGG
jgi:hypothetical protein